MADGKDEEYYEEENWEEGEDWQEGEWDEDGEWDDDYDDDDYDDDEDEEDMAIQIRPEMGGRNRMRNCGIHTIEIYYPQFYFKQIEMEEFDARPDRYGPSVIGKYTKGIGQIEARYPTDDEDPISFSMTCVHRLIERMGKDGFNETFKYSENGETLGNWNSIGRLDIGSESLVDRSKSMKAYVMDLFERYGNCESNIEGVDMYNACYGGQAAGLCCQNWVESDRWDGRYGAAVATDISDAPFVAMFTVGAACTCTLYYPDAPLPHHAHRCSCILHRFDFFKPVGWFHMGPVVDGKYSIDAYMSCVDTCYHTLRKKMNDRPLLQITDYNVFHTGGGWHIVKKAFERCIRAENPKALAEDRERYIQEKLLCSSNLLKIIGPCHTVSSFLNISSVMMQEWDRALGKVLLVFTYGSGCASSMYQLRFDDIMWMEPLGVWKYKYFYRESIYRPADFMIHEVYVETWMKFGYTPKGRKTFGVPYESYQLDAYYLMEIDPWGRRFYHRGGMRAGSYTKEVRSTWSDNAKHYDKTENRGMRSKYGEMPPEGSTYWDRGSEGAVLDAAQQLEDKWKAIEFEMTYDPEMDPEGFQVIEQKSAKGNKDHTLVVMEKKEPNTWMVRTENDGQMHSYHILGTWTAMTTPQEMQRSYDGSHTFEVTLGANGWEQFHILQDGDPNQRIYPAYERSWKDMPCVGPTYLRPETPKNWLITGRPSDEFPSDDVGEPGDKYLVTFRWDNMKRLTWSRVEDSSGDFRDDATYWIKGSWTCWDLIELPKARENCYTMEVQKTPLELTFQIVRNQDPMQLVYPETLDEFGDAYSKVLVNEYGKDRHWNIPGNDGDVFRITLERDSADLPEVSLTWEMIGSRPLELIPNRYFLAGTSNSWAVDGSYLEFQWNEQVKGWTVEVQLTAIPTEFVVVENKNREKVIHPDKKDCSQIQAHEVVGPDSDWKGRHWHIGKSVADKARINDTFVVKLELEPKRSITWKKKDA
mmetsp:Transcript_17395/g.50879  ORF Transcript_17395/g.50879 Transcript_17395/m.50879 type:complete len:982 (-) Transcript_17395:69-3014(-)|eukprot:CAMPEP_0168387062 /NCGR_PEP_ID=MMETSP0228-20121227/15750_1 /TAXON_ID=133427 /ORGANISM="Protoceratium reticulatum, Strain CCCM 535 (=CCMP 1889)" /LENGTH=981 /DNA_ID=CAMNT_0008400283 /DNA_START=53 /DNA_END=2998 /DNA_ORIENTATION=+